MSYTSDLALPRVFGHQISPQSPKTSHVYPPIPELKDQLCFENNTPTLTSSGRKKSSNPSITITAVTEKGQNILFEPTFTEFNPFVKNSASPIRSVASVSSPDSGCVDDSYIPSEKKLVGSRGAIRNLRKSKSEMLHHRGEPVGRQTADFIMRLYHMVEENSRITDSVVSWNSIGTTFIISDVPKFIGKVLPNYFKTGNIQSFVRQLNKYGFNKKKRSDDLVWEFEQKYFRKARLDLLGKIIIKPKEKKTVPPVSLESNALTSQAAFTFSPLPGNESCAHENNQLTIDLQRRLEKLSFENASLKKQQQSDQNVINQLRAEIEQHKNTIRLLQQEKLNDEKNYMNRTLYAEGVGNTTLEFDDPEEKNVNAHANHVDNIVTPIVPSNSSPTGQDPTESFRYWREKYRNENRGSNLKVLVVDDDTVSRTTVSRWLADYGCKPDEVNSGEAALEKLADKHYDLVLMDILMPGKYNGIEATIQIRKINRNPYILAMTSQTDEKHRRKYIDAGMNDVLHKTGKGVLFWKKISEVHSTLSMTIIVDVPTRVSMPDNYYSFFSPESQNFPIFHTQTENQFEVANHAVSQPNANGVVTSDFAQYPQNDINLFMMQQAGLYNMPVNLLEGSLRFNDSLLSISPGYIGLNAMFY